MNVAIVGKNYEDWFIADKTSQHYNSISYSYTSSVFCYYEHKTNFDNHSSMKPFPCRLALAADLNTTLLRIKTDISKLKADNFDKV